MYAIETEKLYKSFDGVQVLRGLDLRVPAGKVYGLLGPNGAGKSTLIHLLLGFLKPSRGSIAVFGKRDLETMRGRIGYLPERLRYHLRYSAREYLHFLGQFSDVREPDLSKRIERELASVGLIEAADRQLSTYSKGMLQRLGIAQALLADPDMLLIDEPTSGLDPAGQREMLQLLAELSGRNHTIFLTTHQLDEVEQLCDTVGVLYGGKLAAELDVQSLRTTGRTALLTVGQLPPEVAARLESLSQAVRCNGREIVLQPNSPALQDHVLRMLLDARVPIISLAPQGRPLEDLYMQIVRGEAVTLPQNVVPAPEEPVAASVAPGRTGTGDTLLRELLNQDHESQAGEHKPPAV